MARRSDLWGGLTLLVLSACSSSGASDQRGLAERDDGRDAQVAGDGDGPGMDPLASGPTGRRDAGHEEHGDGDGTSIRMDAGLLDAGGDDPVGDDDLDAGGAGDGDDGDPGPSAMDAAVADAGTDAAGADAGSDDGGEPSREEFCKGGGAVIEVPDNGSSGAICTPDLGRRLFDHALCTCNETNFAGYLKTRSFDSNAPLPVVIAQGAAVGVNGDLVSGSYVDVGGSLSVIGSTAFAGYLKVGGDLELNQSVTLPGYLQVARDAWLVEDAVLTAATIGRDLYTRVGQWQPPPWVSVGGNWSAGDFGFDDPCRCGAEQLLDVAAIIADGAAHNDNGRIGLSAQAFSDHVGYARMSLPCGRFYLDEITGIGDLSLRIEGRTVVYVQGDVGITGKLEVELAPGAELDLFVGGNLVQIGYGVFGDPARPADLRVYVAGDQDILYLGYQPFAANLYAPRARLVSAGFIDTEGSLFLRDVLSAGYIDITYDRAVLEPDECPPTDPPPTCDRCEHLCGQGACVDGHCGACRDDDDCCGALVCYEDGRCGPLLD